MATPSTPQALVVSLEKAKELLDAGWPQGTSHFVCSTTSDGYSNYSVCERLKPDHPNYESPYYLTWDAPTASEILERLPRVLHDEFLLQITLHSDIWCIGYWNGNEEAVIKYHQFGDTLADAASDMWIYLKQNNLLPPL